MLRTKSARVVAMIALLLAASSCSDNQLTFGGPLEFTVSSNAPIQLTDSLIINYEVRGRSLLGLEVLWGDATVDSVFFAGAQTASGRVAHLFSTDGSYTVTATVTDGLEGQVARELSVSVSP